MKISIINRILLFIAAVLASYQVAVEVDGLSAIPMTAYTIGFGTLLVACLMLIILGYDALESSAVVVISTIIPLTLSFGLVWEYLNNFRIPYLSFSLLGLIAVTISRFLTSTKLADFILTFVHGIAGLIIFCLPIILSIKGLVPPIFFSVGLGGGLIGVGGLLLSFLRTGNPIMSHTTTLKIFPILLFITTLAFVIGFTAYLTY
jgi:hypothetical protein